LMAPNVGANVPRIRRSRSISTVASRRLTHSSYAAYIDSIMSGI
jgi:hypothetical protein